MVQKTLFSSMESVITMMRKMELEEKAVDHATEEATRGGQDIMVKVEEIKQMLTHAKDANDMVVYCVMRLLYSEFNVLIDKCAYD